MINRQRNYNNALRRGAYIIRTRVYTNRSGEIPSAALDFIYAYTETGRWFNFGPREIVRRDSDRDPFSDLPIAYNTYGRRRTVKHEISVRFLAEYPLEISA